MIMIITLFIYLLSVVASNCNASYCHVVSFNTCNVLKVCESEEIFLEVRTYLLVFKVLMFLNLCYLFLI